MFSDDPDPRLTFSLAPPDDHHVGHSVVSDPLDDGGLPHVGEDAGQFVIWVNNLLEENSDAESWLTPDTGGVTAEVLTADPHQDVIPQL